MSLSVSPLPFGGPPAARGTVHLVGGGPGDPGLLGLRAARLLSTATFVAYDRLAPPEALTLCQPDCETVYVGKLPDRHALEQAEIDRLLVDRAREGHAVVRLKGGDPFVLGRGSEEAAECVRHGVPFEVVPAVTSAIAAPAYAGVPVTHRAVAPAFAVVTGHEDPTKPAAQVDYAALARFPGTLVLLMGVSRLGAIAAALVAAGRAGSTPVAVVQWGTTPRQRTVVATLADVASRVEQEGVTSPAVTVVGDVAAMVDELGWFEPGIVAPDWVRTHRPLHGVSVLVPRTRHQAGALSERLRHLGADPIEAPTIAIEPARDPERLRRELAAVADGAHDWVAFTSANAVDAVWAEVEALGADARLFAPARLAAVGSGTADALAARGLRADLLPDTSTARGLAAALTALGDADPATGRRVLAPRADIAAPVLVDTLAEAGWDVTDVEAYRTVPVDALDVEVRGRLDRGDVDVLAFASSSTARNLLRLVGDLPDPPPAVASIGPSTSATCRELGLAVTEEADPHDLDGLVEAVVAAAGAWHLHRP